MKAASDIDLLARYNRQVPRYTSYPTAPHFRHAVTSDDMRDLLAKRKAEEKFSLYFHIPFCHKLCHYCGCFTKVVNSNSPVKAYLEDLKNEIRLVGEALPHKATVSHVHFGGGSPNILSGDEFTALLDLVRDYFAFTDDAEIAMEMDPRLLSKEKISAYAVAGVNRASLGVQDFQEKTQKAVNRIQPFSKIKTCVDHLRAAGITAMNFDLMYGLPYQTVETIRDNIAKTAELAPQRVALFGYAHVPWMRKHQKLLERFDLPDAEQRGLTERTAREELKRFGYKEVGIDHFVQKDDLMYQAYQNQTLLRNFQGYTTDTAGVLLGFGLSAISSYPESYIQNTADIKNYRIALGDDKFPVARSCRLKAEDKRRAAIIAQLMCYFSANLEDSNQAAWPDISRRLRPLQQDGLVEIQGYMIKVTEKGRPFVRLVCACFDAYYDTTDTRHARAV